MNDKKIFLPLTLDNSTKTFFSGKQIFGIIIFGVLLVIYQLLCIRLGTEIFFGLSFAGPLAVAIDVVGTYIIILLFRKIILQENKMMRAYQQNQNLHKTDISFFWDIFTIRDNKIFYCNGSLGVVICLTHGYLLVRAPNQEQIHRDLVKHALGNLAKQGYRFLYYNREVKDSNLGPLGVTEHNLYRYKDTNIYDAANKIIKHTYKVCQSIANTEQEYYVILADQMDAIKKLDHVAKEFLDALHGGIYVKAEVLDNQAIWDFISSLFGISYIDTSALLSKKFAEQKVQLVSVIDVTRTQTNKAASPQTATEPAADTAVDPRQDPNWGFLFADDETEETKEASAYADNQEPIDSAESEPESEPEYNFDLDEEDFVL